MNDLPYFFHIVFIFWVVMDSIGTLPLFVSLLKHFPPQRQRKIILRELLIALFVMVLFLFFGQKFLTLLRISQSSLQIAGGIILFLLALKMIFSNPSPLRKEKGIPKDPLIVPLAIPSLAGPGILAMIILYGGQEEKRLTIALAIFVAWLLSLPFLLFSPFINKILGENGVIAVERLFGYLLVLISSQMTITGLLSNFSSHA